MQTLSKTDSGHLIHTNLTSLLQAIWGPEVDNLCHVPFLVNIGGYTNIDTWSFSDTNTREGQNVTSFKTNIFKTYIIKYHALANSVCWELNNY